MLQGKRIFAIKKGVELLSSISTFKTPLIINFMVTPCINNAEPFYYQLMHIMLKNTELLKHSKIMLQHVSVYI